MSYKRFLPKMILLLGRVMPGLMLVLLTRQAQANPTGMTVQSGSASASTSGSRLTVTAGNNAFLNWQHFNIGPGETTVFNQPSSSSIVWNKVNDPNPSQIYGSLQANGVVVLLNSSGFYFGPNSFVSAAGLVVSTANCLPPQNAGGTWEFNGPPPLASIVNYGELKVGQGGSCYLIADQVENHGTIEAPGGSVGLAAGETIMLSERPDGRGMSMNVTLPKGSVDNYGTVVADAGTISLNAKVVNQNGFIQANSIKNVNGTIELVADDQLNLGSSSTILAKGDNSAGGSAGGSVTLKSNNSFSDAAGSEIITAGGSQGGDGGDVEISAPSVQGLNSSIDARAQAGGTAGKLLLDPDYIVLDSTGSGSAGNGTVLSGSNPGTTLDLNVNTAFANLAVSQITLQAVKGITIAPGTVWYLSGTIGSSFGGVNSGTLELDSGGDIVFGNGATLLDVHDWSVNLNAGYDFVHSRVQGNSGNIYLNGGSGLAGNGSIQLFQGSINLNAGNSIATGLGSQLDGGAIGLNASTIEQDGAMQATSVGTQPGSIQLTASSGELDFGASSQTIANGGEILASGSMVNNNGLIEANVVGSQPGYIQLGASGELDFGAGSQTVANGGKISASSSTMNQSGLIQADSVPNHAGEIDLTASDTLNLNAGSKTQANGGRVVLQQADDSSGMTLNINAGSQVVSDGGMVFAGAYEVNQNGTIEANSQQNQQGVIEIVAGDQLTLGASSQILAQGDNTSGGSNGGNVTLQGGNGFTDVVGSSINTAGGTQGGNGGNIEINSPSVPAIINSSINTGAQTGWQGGQLLFYSLANLELGSASGATPDSTGTINEIGGTGTTFVNVYSAFQNITVGQILLETSGNITLDPNTTWNLSSSTPSQFNGTGQLKLVAGGDIVFGSGSSIQDANGWSITLEAGYSWANHALQPGSGSIILGSSSSPGSGFIQTGSGSINLMAGKDITLGQSGYVNTTANGNISAHALGGNIDTGGVDLGYIVQLSDAATANQGSVIGPFAGGISTLNGGNVDLIAGGNVTSLLPAKDGYFYDGSEQPYSSSPNLNGFDGTGGSGAYGNQAGQSGDVTIVAGGNVTGHYVVAHGTGNISAGVEMDNSGNPFGTPGHYVLGYTGSAGADNSANQLALSLISGAVDQSGNETTAGGWNVVAARDIYLQEVRNPNGVFNFFSDSGNNPAFHLFDYTPDDYVILSAGNLVELGSANLPRDHADDTVFVPPLYPSNLAISAGAGGVDFFSDGSQLNNQLVLFPSATGNLIINTTQGGSLFNTVPTSAGLPQIFNLVLSDAALTQSQYTSTTSFGTGEVQASSPIHAQDPNPVELNISGDMDLIKLYSPKAVEINVVGNMNNCLMQAMNLPGDLKSSITVGADAKVNMEKMGILNAATDGNLTVGGQINNRSAFTSITLDVLEPVPDFAELANAYGNSIDAETLLSSFYYNPTTRVLTYQNIAGFSVGAVINLLENLQVQKTDSNGNPLFTYDSDNNPIPVLTHVSVIDSGVATKLLTEYTAEGLAPSASGGYIVGGGGTFNIDAANINLGTTLGIESVGVGFYQVGTDYPLANLFTKGADININLTGDLTMYSSAIATLNGGNITIGTFDDPIGGSVSVGSSEFNVVSKNPRGIFTTGQGDVSVIANGDIDVNSSRIAAYDGGNVTVASLNGNINAGTGGSGYVNVSSFSVVGGQAMPDYTTIPGSGILATTFVNDPGQVVGNILVESLYGNVNANAGGVVQLPFNGVNTASSLVDVLAGYEMQDSHGNPILAAGMASGTIAKVNNSANGGNIDASGSGVIGSTVELKATGNIIGAIFARDNLVINAQQNVNVTALSEGNLSVGSANGSISGTLIGVGGISASGASDSANLESNNGISGSTSGSKGLAQGTAANATSSASSANQEDSANSAAKTDTATDDDSQKKKKPITLARKVSRVTVLLPGKN